jgi:hypothetical protein
MVGIRKCAADDSFKTILDYFAVSEKDVIITQMTTVAEVEIS